MLGEHRLAPEMYTQPSHFLETAFLATEAGTHNDFPPAQVVRIISHQPQHLEVLNTSLNLPPGYNIANTTE